MKDFINKYNNVARLTATGNLTTAMERVQPKGISNRIEDVFVPFACKAIGILPKEHPLIQNTSHQNRGFECAYLRKDDASEQVWLYVFALKKRMLFRDVHYFKRDMPFRDKSCLSNPSLLEPCLRVLTDTPDAVSSAPLAARTRSQTKGQLESLDRNFDKILAEFKQDSAPSQASQQAIAQRQHSLNLKLQQLSQQRSDDDTAMSGDDEWYDAEDSFHAEAPELGELEAVESTNLPRAPTPGVTEQNRSKVIIHHFWRRYSSLISMGEPISSAAMQGAGPSRSHPSLRPWYPSGFRCPRLLSSHESCTRLPRRTQDSSAGLPRDACPCSSSPSWCSRSCFGSRPGR